MRLLFTCMGTSDPVRGYHDGPMLHIIRHYRPEVICVFLSGEAAALDGCGARLDTVLSHIQNNWGGYAPELRVVRTQIEDPSDMDAVGAPITEAVAALTEEFPDGEVLLNLSSGTPQMKIAPDEPRDRRAARPLRGQRQAVSEPALCQAPHRRRHPPETAGACSPVKAAWLTFG